MEKMWIIADDLTGALDTGVKFAKRGVPVKVIPMLDSAVAVDDDAVVTVWNTDSRHQSAQEAYDRVYMVTRRALQNGIGLLYKKTDSALRGNPGSEIAGMGDAAGGATVFFAPAYPEMNRTVRNGHLYVDEIPVHLTPFGSDRFNPIRDSSVLTLLRMNNHAQLRRIKPVSEAGSGEVLVFDAMTDKDLDDALSFAQGQPLLLAGCAGFADAVIRRENLPETGHCPRTGYHNAAVLSGSIHPVSLRQCRKFGSLQSAVMALAPAQLEMDGFSQTQTCRELIGRALEEYSHCHRLLVTPDPAAERRSTDDGARRNSDRNLGRIGKVLMNGTHDTLWILIGGSTLQAVVREQNCEVLVPMAEPVAGCVLVKTWMNGEEKIIVTKSGGFGTGSTLDDLVDLLQAQAT